jgi:hypothetical protein
MKGFQLYQKCSKSCVIWEISNDKQNKPPSFINRLFLNTLVNELLCKYATNNVGCGSHLSPAIFIIVVLMEAFLMGSFLSHILCKCKLSYSLLSFTQTMFASVVAFNCESLALNITPYVG